LNIPVEHMQIVAACISLAACLALVVAVMPEDRKR